MPFVTGKVWTTGAIYRETRQRVDRRREEGCLVVDMEAAAFFAVARFRGVPFAQLLYGGDDLSGAEWDPAHTTGWTAPDAPNRLGLTLIVTRPGEDTLVGVVHLEPHGDVLHLGYGVAPDHRRAGIASHAVALCSAWAMENGFSRVELEIGEDNDASQAVARRCGFQPTSRTRTQLLPDGQAWHARAWCLEA